MLVILTLTRLPPCGSTGKKTWPLIVLMPSLLVGKPLLLPTPPCARATEQEQTRKRAESRMRLKKVLRECLGARDIWTNSFLKVIYCQALPGKSEHKSSAQVPLSRACASEFEISPAYCAGL